MRGGTTKVQGALGTIMLIVLGRASYAAVTCAPEALPELCCTPTNLTQTYAGTYNDDEVYLLSWFLGDYFSGVTHNVYGPACSSLERFSSSTPAGASVDVCLAQCLSDWECDKALFDPASSSSRCVLYSAAQCNDPSVSPGSSSSSYQGSLWQRNGARCACQDDDVDGVCNDDDACPGFDDTVDNDGDGVADGCDICAEDNPDDSDGDGICDSADTCVLVANAAGAHQTPISLEGVPADVEYQCASDVGSAPHVTAAPCGSVSLAQSPDAVPSDSDQFTVSRTWTATDDQGSEVQAVQSITVDDTTDPAFDPITVPADVVAECSVDAVSLVDASSVVANDNCGAAVDISYEEAQEGYSGSDDDYNHVLTRSWTAKDRTGNSETVVQTVTVHDSQLPQFEQAALPGDVVVLGASEVPPAAALTATDNCAGAVPVAFVEEHVEVESDTQFVVQRTWSMGDGTPGHEVTHTQRVLVRDEEVPVVSGMEPDVTVSCVADIPLAPEVTATDSCGDVAATFTETYTVGGASGQTTKPSCAGFNVDRDWLFTDCHGNAVDLQQHVYVRDVAPPVLEGVPADIAWVECDAVPEASATLVTATDNCDASVPHAVVPTEVRTDGAHQHAYTLVRTWEATDCAGNAVSPPATQTITVGDSTPPVVAGVPKDTEAPCYALPDIASPTATDNCHEDVAITFMGTVKEQKGSHYTLTRTWRATDGAGLTDTVSQVITVKDMDDDGTGDDCDTCVMEAPCEIGACTDTGRGGAHTCSQCAPETLPELCCARTAAAETMTTPGSGGAGTETFSWWLGHFFGNTYTRETCDTQDFYASYAESTDAGASIDGCLAQCLGDPLCDTVVFSPVYPGDAGLRCRLARVASCGDANSALTSDDHYMWRRNRQVQCMPQATCPEPDTESDPLSLAGQESGDTTGVAGEAADTGFSAPSTVLAVCAACVLGVVMGVVGARRFSKTGTSGRSHAHHTAHNDVAPSASWHAAAVGTDAADVTAHDDDAAAGRHSEGAAAASRPLADTHAVAWHDEVHVSIDSAAPGGGAHGAGSGGGTAAKAAAAGTGSERPTSPGTVPSKQQSAAPSVVLDDTSGFHHMHAGGAAHARLESDVESDDDEGGAHKTKAAGRDALSL